MRHIQKFVEMFYHSKDTVLDRDEWNRLKRAVMDDFDEELSQTGPSFKDSDKVKAKWHPVLKMMDRGIVHFDTGAGRRTFIQKPPKMNQYSTN